MNELLGEEISMFTDAVNRFADSEIAPYYAQWERDGIAPRTLWNQLGEAGFLCVDLPEEYGGHGADIRYAAVVIRELSRRGFTSISGSLSVHSDICGHYLLNQGSEAQKQQYLPKMVSGEYLAAVAMTEPGAGSDLQGIRMTAVRDGSDYVLNGSKTFISNGQNADFVITVAKTDPTVSGSKGTSLFIVDATCAGFERGRNLDKIGLHSQDTSELFYKDVRVSEDAILGELNRGFNVLMEELPRERLVIGIGAIGAMQGALEATVEYVKERQVFGKPLTEMQVVRHRLAELHTEYRVARAFVNECLEAYLHGSRDSASASIAKLSATEALGRVADGCLQLFGGYGYMSEYPISRAFVDARVMRIYGGTSEVMKELIARSMLK